MPNTVVRAPDSTAAAVVTVQLSRLSEQSYRKWAKRKKADAEATKEGSWDCCSLVAMATFPYKCPTLGGPKGRIID